MSAQPGGPGGPDGDLEAALAGLAASRDRAPVLVALDFDGTLAPIVPEAAQARALPTSAEAVRRLAAADRVVVALVSGRAMDDLRAVSGDPGGIVLVASHGAEVEGAPPALDERAERLLGRVVEEVDAVVAAHEGTALERKPAGAVLHTRSASPDVGADAAAAVLTGAATWDGVRAMRGKEVVELSVAEADKGSALAALRDRLGAGRVLFAGDDTTDEDAFERLDDAAGDVTLKVGEGATAARHRVADPEALARVLVRLAELLAG